ncbi:MAG: type IV pilus assembly protein PilC [Candidatus Paceibacteria bacterium]|jgi:type IV pilus assembly protein PilC
MLFSYVAVDQANIQREGTVEAPSVDAAITAVQKRGYVLVSIDEVAANSGILDIEFDFFGRVSYKDVVILSRQISTLFQAQVSPLRIFSLLSAEVENKKLATAMNQIVEDLQAGNSISRSLAVHPEIFSSFYVNLVKAGEESGSLDKSFDYLADYLDRQYEIQSKAKNALIYPAFVIGIFVIVMTLMMTQVIPSIATILIDSGQELPIYTQIVINISDFLANYIGYIVLVLGAGAVFFWRFGQTPVGRRAIDEFQLSLPYLGDLQRKLLLTRICDNLSTMLGSGISMVQAIEVTGDVVDNTVFKEIMSEVLIEVKGGRSFAESIAEYPQIPGVLAQMAKVGEETGSLSNILKTLSAFYRREANNAIDTMISLIEPIMIVMLGLGVGVLLASVLMPIYNLTSGF